VTHTGLATRAEVTDAAMSMRAECVMLNKGPHIGTAVRMLADILARWRRINTRSAPSTGRCRWHKANPECRSPARCASPSRIDRTPAEAIRTGPDDLVVGWGAGTGLPAARSRCTEVPNRRKGATTRAPPTPALQTRDRPDVDSGALYPTSAQRVVHRAFLGRFPPALTLRTWAGQRRPRMDRSAAL